MDRELDDDEVGQPGQCARELRAVAVGLDDSGCSGARNSPRGNVIVCHFLTMIHRAMRSVTLQLDLVLRGNYKCMPEEHPSERKDSQFPGNVIAGPFVSAVALTSG